MTHIEINYPACVSASLSFCLSSVCQHCSIGSSLLSLILNALTICSLWLRQIMKLTENQGNIGGARLLLKRLVKNEAGWFSKFLQALEDTEHHELMRELRGEPCNEDGEAHISTKASCTNHLQRLRKNFIKLPQALLEKQESSRGQTSLCCLDWIPHC